jgi:hypothetical protein
MGLPVIRQNTDNMRTILSSALLFTCLNAVTAQYTQKISTGDFTTVEANSQISVNIIQSDSNAVSIESKFNDIGTIKITAHNGALILGDIPRKLRPAGTHITVYAKNLTCIIAKDASTIKSENIIKADNIKIIADDASTITLILVAKSVAVTAKDASTIRLSGSTDDITISASDASTIKGYTMKAGSASVVATDASDVRILVENKVIARASESSDIHIAGNPSQKSTSTNDDGMIKMDATGEINSGDNDSTSACDTAEYNYSNQRTFSDGFIGFGFVLGGSQKGADIKYGRSREFNFGIGGGYKFFDWNGIGADIYYKSTDFFLVQDSNKTITGNAQHASEKIAFNNIGGLVFDRFFIGSFFLDGGFYYEWTFHTKHVTWDNHTSGSESTKAIDRNLSFASPSNYGLTFRIGSTEGFSFYFNYRLSNLIKTDPNALAGTPQLPQYVLGINIGGFDE